jgi:hypothetical protein
MKIVKSITTVLVVAFGLYSCASKNNHSSSTEAKQNTDLDGLYMGLEEMGVDVDPSQPNRKWYHAGHLRIKGDSAFLNQNPVSIYERDTSYSASDGAFYYYNGTYKLKDSTLIFKFKLDHCDYCAHEVRQLKNGQYDEIEQYKELEAIRKSNGFLINNHFYKKKSQK